MRDTIDAAVTELEVLDPGHGDPERWDRFRAEVLERGALELARRRARAATLSGVLSGWSRRLIPVALVAAAVAAILLGVEGSSGGASADPAALEDVLWGDVADGPFGAVMAGDAHDNPVAFMAMVEGGSP